MSKTIPIISLKSKTYIVLIFFICLSELILAQIPNDLDSLSATRQSIDSLPTRESASRSSSSLGGDLTYHGNDTIIYSYEANSITLYGAAWVKFQSYELSNADKITIFMDRNEAIAEYIPGYFREEEEEEESEEVVYESTDEEINPNDPFAAELRDSTLSDQDSIPQFSGKNPLAKPGIPHFSDGNNEFDAKKMRYNFKTKKGMVYDAVTEQENMFVHGGRIKIVSDELEPDSLIIKYNASHTLFTSCDAEVPHYGIRSSKQKIVPGKEVIVGPSHLEIEGIPTPLWLPFGFYPMTTQPKNGLIIPSGYEYSPTNGFGLSNFGYYFPINDNIDLTVLGEVYFRGRWGVNLGSNYKKRYKYSGRFNIDYQNLEYELENSIDRVKQQSTRVTWSHNQAAAANPFSNFSTSVNFSTRSDHNRANYNDFQSVTNNTATSSINYRRRFGTSPFSINVSANSSQNFNQNNYSLSLPVVQLKMKTIYPFKSKSGGSKWYDQVSLNYESKGTQQIRDTVASFFEKSPGYNVKSGVQHDISSSVAFKALKYINVSPSVSLSQDWYFNAIDYKLSAENDSLVADTSKVFDIFNDLRASVSMNTTIYNTILRESGFLRGYRHIMRPSLSFTYAPNNEESKAFGRYEYIDTLGNTIIEDYDRWIFSPYGNPSLSTGSLFLSYSLVNNFEAKITSRRDSTDRKIKLLNNLNFGGSIDLNRDSLQFSDISYSSNVNLLKNYVRLNFGGVYSYYTQNENNRKINTFYWEDRGLPLRFENFGFTINSGASFRDIIGLFQKDKKNKGGTIFDNFRLSHLFRFNVEGTLREDKNYLEGRITSNNLYFQGNIDLSPKWRIAVGNVGYDFKNKNLTYPDFAIERDLHCWAMSLRYQPTRGTYLFNIYVKNGPLSFLKIPYRKNRQDADLIF